MNIQLGDLSISEMEKKAGVTFPEALVELLKDYDHLQKLSSQFTEQLQISLAS